MQKNSKIYFDLSHFALLEVTGSDAHTFLHNQLTCDLKLLDTYGWLFSAWCLPNGRVISTFIIFKHNNSYFMILPGMMKEKIIKRLVMYILHSDVKINDVSDDYTLLGIMDDNINILFNELLPDAIDINSSLINTPSMLILRLWDMKYRYILICKIDVVTGIVNIISDKCNEGDRSTWSLLDIHAGIPWILNSTSESFLPQMLNLDQMAGLSYAKGCYPGQEVIARLHYRGQLKKRLYLGSGNAVINPGTGDQVELKTSGAIVGDVIDAESHPEGGFRLLAVIESSHADKNTLCLYNSDNALIKFTPINYSLATIS
jgi:tRNA-modifying protein YgfZ